MPTGASGSLRALAARVAALEERVERLERGRSPPGDGRGAARTTPRRGVERAPGRARAVVRCVGCGLPLRRRRGRCAECGRPLDG